MDEPTPTTEISKKISAISKESIHRICSGQVVLDLAIAVKELVENSLDSGATVIEVKLIDYGKTCITVVDNGSGVLEKDFEGLGLKHHTSKIKEFSDLLQVETFGFRGEALSSLCALSNLSIITKHATSQHAFNLQFDKNGILIGKKECARQQGTTVCVKNIFKNLPVRVKEFEKNLKKEFAKMIQILYSYCLVSTGVRITCTNSIGNKSANTVVATTGSVNVLDNITAVFGKKARENLIEIEMLCPDKETLEEYNLPSDVSMNFTWKCFVSSCVHTLGRSTSDRQFFYVNGRPCDPAKINKLINFTYHKYNNKQYPFIFLNILLEKHCADVNVTPDKRTILFTQEQLLLAAIKFNFERTWNGMQGRFIVKTLEDMNFKSFKRHNSDSPEDSPPLKKTLFQKNTQSLDNNEKTCTSMEDIKAKLSKYKSKEKTSTLNNMNLYTKDEIHIENSNIKKESHSILEDIKIKLNKLKSKENIKESPETNVLSEKKDETVKSENIDDKSTENIQCNNINSYTKDEKCIENLNMKKKSNSILEDIKIKLNKLKPKENMKQLHETSESYEERSTIVILEEVKGKSKEENVSTCIEKSDKENVNFENENKNQYFEEEREEFNIRKKFPFVTMVISLNSVRTKLVELKKIQTSKRTMENKVKYRTQLNSKASEVEKELEKELTKESFKKMEVIGQFNLGFILTKLNNDLFIVDQHASDEKFRFEKLSNETKLKTQKLILPKKLNLAAVNESILIENQQIFEDNGFTFKIDQEADPGQRVNLTGMPVSFNWQFGHEDIEELIFLIREGGSDGSNSNQIPRPSRVRQMLASRACRSAVMIGKTLNITNMRQLITQMSEMQNPWNCPHGRPTLRHLISLSLLKYT